MKPILLMLFGCAAALAQPLPLSGCFDNCGQYSGDCLACHVTNKTIWFADYASTCVDCNAPGSSQVRPVVPFRAKPVEGVLAFLESFTVKKDPKLAQLMKVDPERHIQLMERARDLRLDGALLGSCRHAFHVGTLDRLPGEIQATRRRLAHGPIPPPPDPPPSIDPPAPPCPPPCAYTKTGCVRG